ncbi:MAG: hypothetical protein JXR94_08715 [Candidatus Hydrogenedentes bacterium]|nr:hypothetical protein [Candidatus Hydrogenedentota bacterium]
MPDPMQEAALPFPLNMAAPGLESFQPPDGPFEPAGAWDLSYGLYSMARRCDRAGGLRLTRTPDGPERARLAVSCSKIAPGNHHQAITAEIECRTDALATPIRWQYEMKSFGPDGQPAVATQLAKKAAVKKDAVEFAVGRRRTRAALPAAYALNWALFDAVQRLPRVPFEPIAFTLIDHFDQFKPGQTLSYWKSTELEMGGEKVERHRWEQLEKGRIRKTSWERVGARPIRLHAYSQLGRGIVPWVYWVDGAGRILAVVAGLEAYILESTAPAAATGKEPAR